MYLKFFLFSSCEYEIKKLHVHLYYYVILLKLFYLHKGCLPTLATVPVWIGLYQALSNVANEVDDDLKKTAIKFH